MDNAGKKIERHLSKFLISSDVYYLQVLKAWYACQCWCALSFKSRYPSHTHFKGNASFLHKTKKCSLAVDPQLPQMSSFGELASVTDELEPVNSAQEDQHFRSLDVPRRKTENSGCRAGRQMWLVLHIISIQSVETSAIF